MISHPTDSAAQPIQHRMRGLNNESQACLTHRTIREAGGFLREQVLTARNINGHWFIGLVYGGLNYQIEHHLLPTMRRRTTCRAEQRIASSQVAAFQRGSSHRAPSAIADPVRPVARLTNIASKRSGSISEYSLQSARAPRTLDKASSALHVTSSPRL